MLNKTIPYGRHNITRKDIRAVVKTLKSEYLTQGPVVPQFETAVASYCGAGYGVATNSATSALHVALLALDVGPGDFVWTSPNSFVASANCALYCGANIDFVDIDAKTYNMSTDALQQKLELAEKSGTLPKVVIPVHFAGQSCAMEKIGELSKKYGFRVIEDASHALGGRYQGEPVGNCQFSDIAVFSFHPVKIITTGEGGMTVTNDSNLEQQMRQLRTHGITTKKDLMLKQKTEEIWNYQQIQLGFNYRLTDIQAALGLSQLDRIDSFISSRHKIAKRYDESLNATDFALPWQHPDTYSSYHLYPIRVKSENKTINQTFLYELLQKNGISSNVHYIPIYRQPYFENLGFKESDFPVAEKYFKETISLPIFPTLKPRIQKKINRVLSNAQL